MKKLFATVMVILFSFVLMSCEKPVKPSNGTDSDVIEGSFKDGSVVIVGNPNINIDLTSVKLVSERTSVKSNMITTTNYGPPEANEYTFKLVAEMNTLKLRSGYETQATDVKIIGECNTGFAFVSYNDKGDPHRGGCIVYSYVIEPGTLESATVHLEVITSIETPNAEFNAVEFFNNKLYLVGASSDPKLGYSGRFDRYNYAFLLVLELNEDKTFKDAVNPKIVKLGSFQATSVKVTSNKVYVTTGDGAANTEGGLYVLNTSNLEKTKFVPLDNARSVSVENGYVYVMQAKNARVTKFDLNGDNKVNIYPPTFDLNSDEFEYVYQPEATQDAARSDMLAWKDKLFVSMNESGLRMLKNNGELLQAIERPGKNPETQVTNSVSMNEDAKKTSSGKEVKSDLLLLSNGQSGVYWYEVVDNKIVAGEVNRILSNTHSVNFVSSKGNVAFVANGLGGLKVLYVGFTEGVGDDEECTGSGEFHNLATFLKANGHSKLDPPLDKKVGDVFIEIKGDNLVITLHSTTPNYKLDKSGVEMGPSLEYFNKINGLFTGNSNADPKDKNVNNGYMTDRNSLYRTFYSDGSARFVFPKNVVKPLINPNNGELLLIIYSGNNAWGYGSPIGPSGTTGCGVNNNGQIIKLVGVAFCD